RNRIPGTERVARRRSGVVLICLVVAFALIAGTAIAAPALLPWRLAVQGIGLAYSYRLVPTPRGRKRIKEIYFLKNFGSACIFVLTSFAYPIVSSGTRLLPWTTLSMLVVFFVTFEMTFEILYDLRDHEGDRLESIPTFPVVHGVAGARRIVDGLLVGASAVM